MIAVGVWVYRRQTSGLRNNAEYLGTLAENIDVWRSSNDTPPFENATDRQGVGFGAAFQL